MIGASTLRAAWAALRNPSMRAGAASALRAARRHPGRILSGAAAGAAYAGSGTGGKKGREEPGFWQKLGAGVLATGAGAVGMQNEAAEWALGAKGREQRLADSAPKQNKKSFGKLDIPSHVMKSIMDDATTEGQGTDMEMVQRRVEEYRRQVQGKKPDAIEPKKTGTSGGAAQTQTTETSADGKTANGTPIRPRTETQKAADAARAQQVKTVGTVETRAVPANGVTSQQLITSVDGQIIDRTKTEQVNAASRRFSEQQALHSRNYADARASEDSQRFQARMERLNKMSDQFHANMQEYRRRNGIMRHVADWDKPVLGEDGKPVAAAPGMEKGGAEYQKRMDALVKQAIAVGRSVKDGYMPGNQKSVTKALQMFADARKSDAGMTAAQMDMMGKQLKEFQGIADKRRAFIQQRQDFFNERAARKQLGERANGLGAQAAIALAASEKNAANLAAATALRDPKLLDADRMRHQKTLMDNGVDAVAMGREAVERAYAGLKGKDAAESQKLVNRFQQAMGTQGATADSVYEMLGNELVVKGKGDVSAYQTNAKGVQIAPSAGFANNQTANAEDARVDSIMKMVEGFKAEDQKQREAGGAITEAVAAAANKVGLNPSYMKPIEPKGQEEVGDANARTYFEEPAEPLNPRKRR